MRFLFRKRIKLFPGISINLSKSEASNTFTGRFSSPIKDGSLGKTASNSSPDSRTLTGTPYPGSVTHGRWILLLLIVLGAIWLLV